MAPFFPAEVTAIATSFPISLSLFAEMDAMFAISSSLAIGFACSSSDSTTAVRALSIPRFMSTGDAPAARYFCECSRIALARTVAVVVPSPAVVLVTEDACLTTCAPKFSNGSSSSTNFATVTPSFVMIGLPPLAWRITFLPLGPRVAATLFANVFTPFNIFSFNVLLLS